MIPIETLYKDVALDNANKDENGHISYEMFNRLLERAELRLIDWLTGDVAGAAPPEPYLTQKNKDWLSPFIVEHSAQVTDGKLARPSDYYAFENLYGVSLERNSCPTDRTAPPLPSNKPIEVLDGQQFNTRSNSFIKSLRPENGKFICKIKASGFHFAPRDIGTVVLEYIRYPKFGKIVTKDDPVYNEKVIDASASTNPEWELAVKPVLVYFITDMFSIHNREQALNQSNKAHGKLARDER